MREGASKVHGLFTALLTPFDSQGRVNRDALSALVKYQISKKVDGLYPCGSTGLGPLLSLDERKVVAETVVQEAAGKVPVVVQIGCSDTASSVELARHAEKVGADAVASLTPYYYKPGEKAMIKHFGTLSKEISIPLLAYNIPQFTGNPLSPSLVAEMANMGIIDGIKDSHRDVLNFLELIQKTPDNFVVMNGTEEYAAFVIMMGGDGLVSGGANAYPELFVSLVTAEKDKDYAALKEAQKEVLRFKDTVGGDAIPSYYALLKKRGIDCGDPRPPILPLSQEASARMMDALLGSGFPAKG